MYLPDDFNVCLLAVVLMQYHNQQHGYVKTRDEAPPVPPIPAYMRRAYADAVAALPPELAS